MTRLLFWGLTSIYSFGAFLALTYDKLDLLDFASMLLLPFLIGWIVWYLHRQDAIEWRRFREQFDGLGVNVDGSYFRGKKPQRLV